MLGVSPLQYLQREAQASLPYLTMEGFEDELGNVFQYEQIYPRQGEKGSRAWQRWCQRVTKRSSAWWGRREQMNW